MKLKKILAGLLAGAMVLTSVPVTALAAGDGRELQVIDDDPTPAASEVLEEAQESVPEAYTAEETVELEKIEITADAQHITSNSEEGAGTGTDGPGWWAFDGNDEHWWHSRYNAPANGQASENNPVWVQAALGARKAVKQIKYMPRPQDYAGQGCINRYEIYVADMADPTATPSDTDMVCIKQGNLRSTADEQDIDLPVSIAATHVRIQVTSTHYDGDQYVSAKSIKILENTAVNVENAVDPDENPTQVSVIVEGNDTATGTATPARFLSGQTMNIYLKASVAETDTTSLSWILDGATFANGSTCHADFSDNAQVTLKYANLNKVTVAASAANSEHNPAQGTDGPASYAFNGNEGNWWHSRYGGTPAEGEVSSGLVSESNPIWIQAYLGETAKNISKIIYASRANSSLNAPNAYEIFAANCPGTEKPDSSQFASVMKGNMGYGGPQTIHLPFAVEATHIRIQVTSVHSSGKHVTARRIDIYEEPEAADVHHIVATADYIQAAVNDAAMGSATVSGASVMLENTDTTLSLNASANPGYRFINWTAADGSVVSTDPVTEVTINTNKGVRTFTATFKEGGYTESSFWDEEMTKGTLATQDADEMWHYQIKGDTDNAGRWSDITSACFHTNKWLQNGDNATPPYHWAKISRDELTSTFDPNGVVGEAVAYAWKAPDAGYYRATLEGDITDSYSEAERALEVFVAHVDHNMLQSDGKLLYEGNIGIAEADGVSKNFFSKVAKVEAGDYIRIGAKKKDAWVSGFLPMIERVSVRDYAAERAADVEAAIEAGVYSSSSATDLTAKVNALKTAAESTANTDDDVETALTALEEVVQAADVALSVTYENPTVGQPLAITDEDKLFYDNANVLSFDVLFKLGNVNDTNYLPLVTLSDGQGEFITVWLNPKINDNQGRAAIFVNGNPTGLYFSKNSCRVRDNKWHKLTFTVNKAGQMYFMMDGNTNDALSWNFSQWDSGKAATVMNNIKSYTVDHNWSVKEVLLGKKATNGVYGGIPDDNTGIVDATEADGLQVKYARVYAKNYTGIAQLNDENSEATFKNGNTEEWRKYSNLAGESLNAADYMDEGWDAYHTAWTNGQNKTADREVLNALEEISPLREALQPAAKITLASRGHGSAQAALTLNGEAVTSGKVNRGAQVTVTAPATVTEGDVTYTFAYWADATGTDRKVSTECTYTLYPFVNMNLVAVYEASAETTEPTTTTIVFRTTDRFSGMVWEAVVDGTNIEIPAAPSFIGYTFDGWYSVDEGNGTPVDGLASGTVPVSNLGGHKEFEARYTAAETCDVTFVGCGTITTTDPAHSTIEAGERVTVTLLKDAQVTVTAPEGSTFGGWYMNGELVSANTTYKFWVKGTTTVEARTAETAVTSAVPLAAFQITERTEASKAKLSMAWDAPEGSEIVEIGILRAYADTDAAFDAATMTVDNTAISRTRCSKLGSNGSYTLTVKISSAARQAQTIYARGYIVYKTADGLGYAYTNCVGLTPTNGKVTFTEQAQ